MDFSKIPIGRNPPREVNVVIEIPMGGNPVKYEFDKESGAMYVDRFLHTAMYMAPICQDCAIWPIRPRSTLCFPRSWDLRARFSPPVVAGWPIRWTG